MDEIENIMNKIQDYLGNSTNHLKILEEQIDIGLQMKYYKQSAKVKAELDKDEVLAEKDSIFDPNLSLGKKKTLLCKLASIDDVTAFRTIEKFLKDAPKNIYQWTFLAFQESKVLLESALLNENVLFISTGLGGKEGKLRYNIVFFSKTEPVLNDFHKKIIKNESEHIFKQFDCIREKLELKENYCSMIALVPLKVDLKNIFDKILSECNLYGNFLNPGFIISNVKVLDKGEIIDIIENKMEIKNRKPDFPELPD